MRRRSTIFSLPSLLIFGILLAEIGAWMGRRPNVSKQLLRYTAVPVSGSSRGLSNPIGDMSYRISLWNIRRKMDPQTRAQTASLAGLLKRRRTLDRQRSSLAQARRLMALWHTLHVPLGLALFAAAFVHIVAAIYFATLLR